MLLRQTDSTSFFSRLSFLKGTSWWVELPFCVYIFCSHRHGGGMTFFLSYQRLREGRLVWVLLQTCCFKTQLKWLKSLHSIHFCFSRSIFRFFWGTTEQLLHHQKSFFFLLASHFPTKLSDFYNKNMHFHKHCDKNLLVLSQVVILQQKLAFHDKLSIFYNKKKWFYRHEVIILCEKAEILYYYGNKFILCKITTKCCLWLCDMKL